MNEAYKILIDEEKRRLYDQNGQIDDDLDIGDFYKAYQFYRNIFKKIEKNDIGIFFYNYKMILEKNIKALKRRKLILLNFTIEIKEMFPKYQKKLF